MPNCKRSSAGLINTASATALMPGSIVKLNIATEILNSSCISPNSYPYGAAAFSISSPHDIITNVDFPLSVFNESCSKIFYKRNGKSVYAHICPITSLNNSNRPGQLGQVFSFSNFPFSYFWGKDSDIALYYS